MTPPTSENKSYTSSSVALSLRFLTRTCGPTRFSKSPPDEVGLSTAMASKERFPNLCMAFNFWRPPGGRKDEEVDSVASSRGGRKDEEADSVPSLRGGR